MSVEIQGQVAPGFEAVADAFRENFALRGEVGASACAYLDGERVVDLWAGRADAKTGRAWEADTMSIVFSATKGLAATCLLMLADRGLLDYDRPVADYWPEFANSGKRGITVRELLNHRAGLCAIDQPLRVRELGDRLRASSACENQRPIWSPGTEQGYMAVSFGVFVAELFQRVAGCSVGRFLADEVAKPLAADVYIGLPEAHHERVATLLQVPTRTLLGVIPQIVTGRTTEGRIGRAALNRKSPMRRAFGNPSIGRGGLGNFNHRDIWEMELPFANGIASARGLATVYAALANGGSYAGTRLCSPETLEPIYKRQSWAYDRVLHKPLGFSQGFVKEESHLFSPNEESFGHPGMGGALGWADPTRKLSFGYVMNQMDHRLRSPRSLALCHAIYASL